MRGGWRGKVERPPLSQLGVQSYVEAVYPPRAYHYHEQLVDEREGGGATAVEAIVLPSIDADTSCEPHVATRSEGGVQGAVVERRAPPRLRDYAPCFLPDTSGIEGAVMAHCMTYKEPLNVSHYPQLQCDVSVLRDCLPRELWSYASLMSGHDGNVPAALRIRSVRRPHALHPIRRGAKVVLMSPRHEVQGHTEADAARKRPRAAHEAGEEGVNEVPVKRMKHEEDDGTAAMDAVEASEEDDEASIDMQREDDDENNDDLSDGGGDDDDGGGGYDDGGGW